MAELIKKVNELSLGYRKMRRPDKRLLSGMKKGNLIYCHPSLKELHTRTENPKFDCFNQLRILLFRERYGQERRLLFDSKAVKKKGKESDKQISQSNKINENSIERSFKLNNAQQNEYIIEWPKHNSDEKMLQEMIFGSVSTSYQGTTLKIHTIKSPPQIVISVVFPAPSMASFNFGRQDVNSMSHVSSCAYDIVTPKQLSCTDIHSAHSVPVDVPRFSVQGNNEENCDFSDSFQSLGGNTSLPSYSELGSKTSLVRSGSYNSLQRRVLRNKATSIELGFQTTDSDYYERKEIFKVQGESRVKLGLSVVIALNPKTINEERSFQDFLFSHISLVENHIMDLKSVVIEAYLIRKKFIHFMYEGAAKFIQSMQDLCSTPRLEFPKWLSIVSSSSQSCLNEVFMNEFSRLLRDYDRKETNFFVSTFLTTVLIHHLSWVPTVIPSEEELCCEQSCHNSHWVYALAKSRPYNPLWVQMSDLYGALSHPLKLVKIVITGTKKDVIIHFLKFISYFIRCNDIYEQLHDDDFTQKTTSHYIHEHQCETQEKDTNFSKFKHCVHSSPMVLCHDEVDSQVIRIRKSANHEPKATADKEFSTKSNESKLSFCCMKLACDSIISDPQCSLKKKDSLDLYCNECCVNSCECDKLHFIKSQNVSIDEISKLSNYCVSNSSNMPKICDLEKIVCNCKEKVPKLHESVQGTHQVTDCNNCSSSEQCNDSEKVLKSNLHQFGPLKDEVIDTQLNSVVLDNLQLSSPTNKNHSSSSSKSHVKKLELSEEGYQSLEENNSSGCESLPYSDDSLLSEEWSPDDLIQQPVPQCFFSKEIPSSTLHRSFGWSLMAGVNDHFISDFCLQGVSSSISKEEIHQDLLRSTQVHMFDEPINEAVCILANTDSWNVEILSVEHSLDGKLVFDTAHACMSILVSNMCEAVLSLMELGVTPESGIAHIEDRLREFHSLSLAFSECMHMNDASISPEKIATLMGLDKSDVPLMRAISSTQLSYLNLKEN